MSEVDDTYKILIDIQADIADIKARLTALEARMDKAEARMDRLTEVMIELARQVASTNERMEQGFLLLDRSIGARLRRIETHVNLPPM
jgi:peptidoglycan hydrolase CwlO-like protein